MDLRKDEFQALDIHLLHENEEYKDLANYNIELFLNVSWKMKASFGAKDPEFAGDTIGLLGYINYRGYLRCIPIETNSCNDKLIPVKFEGTLDHLGTAQFKVKDNAVCKNYRVPDTYNCIIRNESNIEIEVDKGIDKYSKEMRLIGLMGQMVSSNSAIFENFTTNKDRMIGMINKRRVKI